LSASKQSQNNCYQFQNLTIGIGVKNNAELFITTCGHRVGSKARRLVQALANGIEMTVNLI